MIRHILEYLETPQYLRKRLFPLDESLRFAGLLPPLRIPSHKPKVPLNEIERDEIREGVVHPNGLVADIGLDSPIALKTKTGGGKRATIRVVSTAPLTGVLLQRAEVTGYWGYVVEVHSIDEVMTDSRFGLKLATSRLGDSLQSCIAGLREEFDRSKGVMTIFGSPTRGLFDTIKNLRQRVPFVVNLYPEQNVATVRTEEAMVSALYLLELLSVLENTKV